MRNRSIPTLGARIFGIVVKGMRVAGHCRKSGKMLLAQGMRHRREDFAGREIVEIALRHLRDHHLPPPLAGSMTAYSITLSARSSCELGTSMPIAFAVFRLNTSSNLVGCSTGMS